MKGFGTAARLATAGTVAALLAAVVVAAFWDGEDYVPAPDDAQSRISPDELARAAQARLFFGHMSVGANILGGVQEVFARTGVAAPEIVQVAPGDPVPQVLATGVVVHTEIGENGDPLDKLANFDAALRSGLAGEVDVALLKFCYVDITAHTDVDALLDSYKRTLDALERDFPGVRFLHATAPLTVAPAGIKGWLKALRDGGDDNPARERYNALVRATYGPDRLLDVAAVEATAPDGSRAASLYPGYSSDGAHLNSSGSGRVAVELLRLVADAR